MAFVFVCSLDCYFKILTQFHAVRACAINVYRGNFCKIEINECLASQIICMGFCVLYFCFVILICDTIMSHILNQFHALGALARCYCLNMGRDFWEIEIN